jgi:hypothetical protein
LPKLGENCIGQIKVANSALDRIHQAGRLLDLQKKHSAPRLEAACQRALDFGDPAYMTVKRILTLGLEKATVPIALESSAAQIFVRELDELIGAYAEVPAWS